MERVANPYRPGFNQSPETLAGRDDVLEDLVDAVEVAALDQRTPRPILLVGSRGVGKTVLLGEVAARAAREYGWPWVHVEVRPRAAFTPDLIASVDEARRMIEQGPPRRLRAESATVRAQVAGVGGEVRFERSPDVQDDPVVALRRAVVGAVQAAVERGTGFVLTLDELQLADRAELAALASLLQEGTGRDWPLVVVAAGLWVMREPAHSVTYFERGAWHEIGLLSLDDASRALQGPAERAGRPMAADAAVILARASGGYPYAIQLYGHHAWRTSAGQSTIDRPAAEAALPRAQRELDRGLYAARWTTATRGQQEYLRVAAELAVAARPTTGRAIAEALARTPQQLSRVRSELLHLGTLTAEGSRLRFTVPGMAEFIVRQEDDAGSGL